MLKFRAGKIYKPRKNHKDPSGDNNTVEIEGIVKNKQIDLQKKASEGNTKNTKNSNIDLLKNTLTNLILEPKQEKKKRIIF